MAPFSDPYFYWQNTVRGDGIKVVTIVKLPNSEFPIVVGDVKEMREDLKKIARESSRPGVDYRFTFALEAVRSFNGSVQLVILSSIETAHNAIKFLSE